MNVSEKIGKFVEHQITMSDCVDCFAVPGASTMIDMVHPITGKTVIYGLTLDEVRQRPGDEKAEQMSIDDFCKAKAERQDTPIAWTEIDKEKYSYYLEVLPPIAWKDGAFLVGEASDHHATTGQPRYQACKMQGGKFYASNRPLTRSELKAEMA